MEKSPHYIHVTRTCQNAHPFENFTFCKRLARGIHSPGNTLRSLTCTRLYEQRRTGQRNSASGPQTSQNRRKRRSRQGIPDRKPRKIQLVIHQHTERRADLDYHMAIQPQSRCEPLVIRWITSSSPYKVKLVFRKYVNYNIINKNANVNCFRKKLIFLYNFFLLRYNQDKNGKDGLAQ